MRTFRVNDIFYSLQGEGRNTGRAAVFIRFAGCNLRCPFCDTEFDSFREMTDKEIIETIDCILQTTDCILQTTDCRPQTTDCRPQTTDYRLQAIRPLVVLTGGEPTLQVDETFVDLLHQHSYEVAMESNGTRPAPRNLDWLTVSPKIIKGEKQEVRGERQEVRGERLPDELKIVFDKGIDPESFLSPLTSHHSPLTSHHSPLTSHHSPLLYLQPCDTGDAERNAAIIKACVAYIKEHPQWRLSLQTHKLIGIE